VHLLKNILLKFKNEAFRIFRTGSKTHPRKTEIFLGKESITNKVFPKRKIAFSDF
jgi:hypothetical protein